MARRTSSFTEPRRRSPLARIGVVALGLGVVQALLFYDHFAVALTLLFGLGFGVWLRTWKAALPALASFAVGFALALVTGWLHDARLLWEPLLGGALAVLGAVIGGGIFDVLRRDVDAHAPAPARMEPL